MIIEILTLKLTKSDTCGRFVCHKPSLCGDKFLKTCVPLKK